MIKKKSQSMFGNLQEGFTLFIAIVIMGTLLLISTGVINLAVKQAVISSSGKESQLAFYAADSGMECALYWDVKSPTGHSAFATSTGSTIYCNQDSSNPDNEWVVGGSSVSTINHITLLPSPACAIVTVTKNPDNTTLIESFGYNTCDNTNPRRVERAVRATYGSSETATSSPSTLCEDSTATNFGGALPCEYPPTSLAVEYLIMGGGGGGGGAATGSQEGGGGGAGYLDVVRISSLDLGASLPVVVGAGGGPGTNGGAPGGTGGTSSFNSHSAGGGGGGGWGSGGADPGQGNGQGGGGSPAGSGGGGGVNNPSGSSGGGGVTSGGQGNSTGLAPWGGGGGGAGGGGTSATGSAAGNGGSGASRTVADVSTLFAAGGAPGSGGSGSGWGSGGDGGNGTTGGGTAGSGRAGKVIIWYLGSQSATGGTVTTVNGYTVHTFTSSGTFTVNP